MIKSVLPDNLQLVVLWQLPTLRYLNSDDMQTPIIGSTGKTVGAFDDTDALHFRVMLSIRMPRLACHIPL
jgi:hypothetical protein